MRAVNIGSVKYAYLCEASCLQKQVLFPIQTQNENGQYVTIYILFSCLIIGLSKERPILGDNPKAHKFA